LNSATELFWTQQEVYLLKVFLPIIIVFLILSTGLVVLFALGFLRRYLLWRRGHNENRFDRLVVRLNTTLAVVFAHFRVFKEAYPGIMHFLIVWGVILLFAGKIVRLFSYVVGLNVPPQDVFLYASFVSEIGGLMIIIGGIVALIRRYIVKPSGLDNKPDDALIFLWVFVVLVTGYLTKGYRIAVSDVGLPTDWFLWSPVGYFIAKILPIFTKEYMNEILVWHRAIIHTVPAFVLFAYMFISRTRLQHIWLSPLNVFFRSLKPKGALVPIDLETAESWGASKIEDFTWKQLLDLDACTRCGRCQDNCPAHLSGKKLSPKKVVLDLKENMYEVFPIPFLLNPKEPRRDMISEVITEEVVWDCTTCRACMEACPVYIEHINKIIDMRRNLVLERASIPETGEAVLKCIEARGHSCRGTTLTRTDWTSGLDIKTLSEDSEVDLVYFVGCAASLEERSTKIAMAFVKILRAAGVKVGVLGIEETCCGEPARRLGNEYLFQMQAQKNIEMLKNYNVKKVVTTCPHCFNTLKNEYPQYGGEFEVLHHTQIIAQLLKENKIKSGCMNGEKLAYHDSCYLGRHNDIYEQPRDILHNISPKKLLEMDRSRNNGFCCGGGGGRYWMEEKVGQRISEMRIEQVMQTGTDVIATACPYCLQMFIDAIKAKGAEETLRAVDVAELLAAQLDMESSK